MNILLSDIHTSAANLALSKQTSQSSRVHYSSYGVDGIYLTKFEKKPCTHTDSTGEMSPWWRVDLGRVEPVSEVYLVNRDCSCADRLWNIDVRVGKLTVFGLDISVFGKPRLFTTLEN